MGAEVGAAWSAWRRERALARLAQMRRRAEIINAVDHPAALARSCDPNYVITPAVELVSRKIERVLRSRRKRLMITAPPQEFKSLLCAVWTPLRALQLHPDWRVMLLTYADGLAEEHSRTARAVIQEYGTGVIDSLTGQPLPDRLGISLHPDKAQAANWRIQEGDGGLVAAGRDATITGRRADLLIVDDPFKNMQEADSEAIRRKVIDWYHSVATTRLAPGASVILIQCMTGDTPVLRPDGSETPLRDIRPGDEIATYEGGQITTATVRNWANQGPDDVLCIRMMSGRTVRANARHPFLTVKDGVETWKRASEITSGDRLVALSGAPGAQAWPVPQTDAMSAQSARACAPRTTRRHVGPPESAVRLGAGGHAGTSSCGSATASITTSTTASSQSRTAVAQSAAVSPKSAGCRSTGTAISASTTVTTPQPCADSFATTATSCSDAEARPSACAQALTTWSVTADEVVEVVPCGREEVYDIEVERTENFIANGLVSHNTRWHPGDLAGHLLQNDRELPPELREWHYINIPAISHPALPDALNRQPGVALESARGRTKEDFEAIQRNVGKRVWNALYQGSPTPPEGGLFSQAWFDEHRMDEMPARTRARIVAVDPSESGEGDEAGVIGAALLYPPSLEAQTVAKLMSAGGPDAPFPQVLLTHDRSGPMTSEQWAAAAVDLALETYASDIVVETYTAGTTYLNVVRRHIAERLRKLSTSARTDETRAQMVALRTLAQRVRPWRGTGDAVARSGLLRQAIEVGTCVVLGHEMAGMEEVARLWQAGQHQPDRVAAAVIAHDTLVKMAGKVAQFASPAQTSTPNRRNAGWLERTVG